MPNKQENPIIFTQRKGMKEKEMGRVVRGNMAQQKRYAREKEKQHLKETVGEKNNDLLLLLLLLVNPIARSMRIVLVLDS